MGRRWRMAWLSRISVAIALMLALVAVQAALALYALVVMGGKRWRSARVRRRASGKWQDRTTRLLVVVLAVLALPGLAVALLAAVRGDDWWGFWLNLGTELVGAVLVYILLQLFLGRESRKRELIEKMGSTVHDVAIEAVEGLRHRGWLYDGSLQGAILFRADLREANLNDADLRGANLAMADLRGADLWDANLQGANLGTADLRGARPGRADLRGALLYSATCKGPSCILPACKGKT